MNAPGAGRVLRVAVVGAGFAGLAAAVALVDEHCEVTVLEARTRVGGRVWSERVTTPTGGSAVIERGAEFVLHGYDRMRRHCDRFGLHLVETGMSYYVRQIWGHPALTADLLARAGHRAAAAFDPEHPRSAAIVVEGLGVDPVVAEALLSRVEISSAAPAHSVRGSVLYDVASFESLLSWRVGEGNQSLAHAMHHHLGDRVLLGTEVSAVTASSRGVVVTTSSAAQEFDAVIVALPLEVVRRGIVTIELPDWKRQALSRLVQGVAAKLHLPLAAAPATSAVLSAEDRFWTWTATGGDGDVPALLNAFCGSPEGIRRLDLGTGSPEDGSRWVERIHRMRRDMSFDDTVRPIVTEWQSSPYSLGAYSSPTPQFGDDDLQRVIAPVGQIHFAGEYAGGEFVGIMEGALRSGELAAAQVLAMSNHYQTERGTPHDDVDRILARPVGLGGSGAVQPGCTGRRDRVHRRDRRVRRRGSVGAGGVCGTGTAGVDQRVRGTRRVRRRDGEHRQHDSLRSGAGGLHDLHIDPAGVPHLAVPGFDRGGGGQAAGRGHAHRDERCRHRRWETRGTRRCASTLCAPARLTIRMVNFVT